MPPGEYILLTVRDTGYGICARGSAPCCTTEQELSGVATEIPTIVDFVRQTEGHIWVSCKRGGGTTFEIYLPRSVN
jgi:signal transduction histidine kinase